MVKLRRRELIAAAMAAAATHAWAGPPKKSARPWQERRDLYPQGVASGDPGPDSVLLWTRREAQKGSVPLTVEVAEDREFQKVVATARTTALPEADWTVRVLVGGLEPAREYWYRFLDKEGLGSRIGRTLTAPGDDDPRPVRFAFVSCQDVSLGAQNAYRRMIWEDSQAPEAERLGFVLHLGDFIYEVVWYPEDVPHGRYDRRVRELVRYPHGQRVEDCNVPTTLEDYRAVYKAYLRDPDLQDARAFFPFVCMWDNHEFSWRGWQSFQNLGKGNIPAQTRKVAANQAWFEYLPARVSHSGKPQGPFAAPKVVDAPIERFDAHGLGQERHNLAAIRSLKGYRAFRYGRHLELIITDQHSYRSEEPLGRPEAQALSSDDFPEMIPQEAMEILDAGRTHGGGKPPDTVPFGATSLPNFRKNEPAQTLLGTEQKAWMLARLKASRATWKVWGVSSGTLDWRADPQNLPTGLTRPWPGAGYAGFGGGDYSSAYTERGEIYDLIEREKISGFVSVAGDRHSFWAGLAAKALPPARFQPVGLSFVTGSISSPGLVEAYEHRFPKQHPLRALYLADRPGGAKPEATVNMLMRHGVRSCLEYARSGDAAKARALSNPDNAPHLQFVDMGGHGYATVRLSADAVETEFVCIPRPVERSTTPDGGPLRYRLRHRAALWQPGEAPALEQRIIEGDPGLGL